LTSKTDIVEEILKELETDKSQLIEIVGQSGTGKSYLFKKLSQMLVNKNIIHYKFIPQYFAFNQIREIVKLITKVNDEDFYRDIRNAWDFETNSKYDFFYFLSDVLKQKALLKPSLILIDNADLLDQYSVDFIQYLVQFAHESKIQIITFSSGELFPFSTKKNLKYLKAKDIAELLKELFPEDNKKYDTEAEIIENMTGGNVFLIENLILSSVVNEKGSKLEFQKQLNKISNVQTLMMEKLSQLDEFDIDCMIYIWLFDRRAGKDCLTDLLKQKSPKIDKTLNKLVSEHYIGIINDSYYIRKVNLFSDYMKNHISDKLSAYITKFLTYIQSNQVPDINLAKYYILKNEFKQEIFEDNIVYLKQINDHNALLEIYQFLLDHQKQIKDQIQTLKEIGVIYRKLKQLENAADTFRQALRMSATQQITMEEIVYLLSRTLYELNSNSFALEIIKTYDNEAFNPIWKARIELLKAEIVTEQEDFNTALESIDKAVEYSVQVDTKFLRNSIQAEAKKVKGKIFYFSNLWDKAEASFKEAESLYKSIDNTYGLAAIYNNIGVLKMFQGEWDTTEKLYLASLELEKKHYNLEGIAVCYNNLGGLADDQGDYRKSLYYFNEALVIQKLLSERYNISNCYNNIGVTYMDNGEYDKAIDAYEKSLETAINFGLFKNVIASLNNLGAVYFKTGNWTKAIEYYESAINKSKEMGFMEGLLRSYNNLGELYEKRGEYNLAYDLYFKGQEIVPNINDDYLKAELYGNLGSVLTQLHKFGEAYGFLVESYDFFKSLNAKDKIFESSLKHAWYFIQTRNYESADYYLNLSGKNANELNNLFYIGQVKYLRAILEKKDIEKSRQFLEEAIELFKENKNLFELSLAYYEYAVILNESGDWEQALHILTNNRKIVKDYGAIKFLEQNDMLSQKITKEHSVDLKETKFQESLLNKFSDIIQKLNSITDFDVLLETSLDLLVEFSEADGGVLCLYNSRNLPDSWEYKQFNHYSNNEKDYDSMMDLIQKSYTNNQNYTYKQPYFAMQYNDIATFSLNIRNHTSGVILLFSKHGSHYFAEKMINLLNSLCNQIIVIIENIRHSNLAKSHAVLREELESGNQFTNIVGKSPKMNKIFDLIDKIKDAPTTILIEGPSGTGKELIARAIHYNSNRRNKKFVAQYCGALPETLLESELFGHVKGSFTGATYDKKGLFEIADGGTFFLDEIADISLSTQAKLLRFLQEGEIKRVGSTKTEKVDVRVICATNVSLLDKVKKGEFRLDLYYRLNVIRLQVPSLSERKSDIPLLAIHFLDKYNQKIKKRVMGITDESMKYLINYEWPGNIRQLENEVERAVTLAENDSFIKPNDLSEEVYKFSENTETVAMINTKMTLKDAIEDLEKRMIERTMLDTKWN
ncbi:MAG TPA: sigma 54-interacting transcriptional regulator, partial [Candidatus Cloacimonadota bacterium]|nr:sigma 54-interacting transcriptional regulator [Candidatus Cloacimonadota bacterium]